MKYVFGLPTAFHPLLLEPMLPWKRVTGTDIMPLSLPPFQQSTAHMNYVIKYAAISEAYKLLEGSNPGTGKYFFSSPKRPDSL
jgi:hypothetical protein